MCRKGTVWDMNILKFFVFNLCKATFNIPGNYESFWSVFIENIKG